MGDWEHSSGLAEGMGMRTETTAGEFQLGVHRSAELWRLRTLNGNAFQSDDVIAKETSETMMKSGTRTLVHNKPAKENWAAARKSARYGIDVRGYRAHAEAADLEEILSSLDGVEGMVSVVDRDAKGHVLHGTASEVRRAIIRAIATQGKGYDDVDANVKCEHV
jgi:hypothetical protein